MKGFRVWSKSLGKYIDYGMMISQDGELLYMDVGHEFQEVPSENCIDYIVEYQTGLKDKNGEEIYEGDIVRIDSMDELRVGYVELVADQYCIVCGEDEEGYKIVAEFYYYSKPEENCEVIGNIHENAESLEEK